MKAHTNNFKEQIKLIGKEIDSIITFGDTVLGKSELNAVTPSFQSSILKSAMKQLDIDSNVYIPVGTVLKYEFGLKVNGEYEYIDFGNYIVKEVEKQEDTSSYKITCYDKMLLSMKDYAKMPITYPITIRDYINSLCAFLGLSFANENDTFVNYNKTIPAELYLDSEGNGLGYTFRDVFDELAQVTASTICINDNDEVEIRYINDAFNTNKVSGLGSVSFDEAIEEDIKSLVIDGKSTQNGVSPSPDYPSEIESVGYENLFDINATPIFKINSNNTTIEDGVRVNLTTSGSYYAVIYKMFDVSDYVGKTFKFKANFEESSNNKGQYILGLCDANGNNRITGPIATKSGELIELTIPTLTTSTYLAVWLYSNVNGIGETNDYVDYTNIILSEGEQEYSYIPYGKYAIEFKISNAIDTNTSLILLNEPLRSLPNGLKDIAYIRNGKLYVNRYVGSRVFTGDENWVTNVISISNGTIFSIPRGNMKANITTNYMSSHFIPRSTSQSPWNNGSVSTDNSYLNICMTDISTVDEFKTWLAENKPQLNYVLSNPYIEELGEISIKALDGTNNINLLTNIETNFEIEYITGIDTIDEEFLKDVNVNFGEKYGKVNSIVLSRSGQSDNVYLQDEASIAENSLTELKIIDNQIMNFNDRSDYLPEIFGKLNGLEYYLNDFSSTGITYYDLCDRYNVKIGDTTYSCVMFNDEILITQGLEENVYTETPEETQTDYTKADKTDRRINQAYIIVDKQNQEIQALASKVIDVSNTISGSGSIKLENAHEGILNELSISGNLSLIFPSENLYPSSDLYPLNFALKVDDEIYDLDINFLNYMSASIYDKFVYKNGKCQIIRKVGVDNQGNLYELENEIIEERKDILINVRQNSTITSLNFPNAIMSATYLTQNDYTNVFATQVEVESSITQTANTINLSVNEKLDGKDFTGANIMLAVNNDNSSAQINADKISLKGKEINMTTDNITIDSQYLDITSDGQMNFYTPANITPIVIQQENNNNIYKTIISGTNMRSFRNDIKRLELHGGYPGSYDYSRLYLYNNNEKNVVNITAFNEGNLTLTNANNDGAFTAIGNTISISDDQGYVSIDLIGETGNIYANNFVPNSRESIKKNIEIYENALTEILNTDIYKYNLKSENDDAKKHVGFVIGNKRKYSKDITAIRNNEETGADLYSMISVLWQGVKEQQKIIEQLKQEITLLKESDK